MSCKSENKSDININKVTEELDEITEKVTNLIEEIENSSNCCNNNKQLEQAKFLERQISNLIKNVDNCKDNIIQKVDSITESLKDLKKSISNIQNNILSNEILETMEDGRISTAINTGPIYTAAQGLYNYLCNLKNYKSGYLEGRSSKKSLDELVSFLKTEMGGDSKIIENISYNKKVLLLQWLEYYLDTCDVTLRSEAWIAILYRNLVKALPLQKEKEKECCQKEKEEKCTSE